MVDDPIVAELRAASASLVTASAAAEMGDWPTAEQGALDAQHRVARVMKEISIKLLNDASGETVIAPRPVRGE
jgi:hypothetical protein